MNKVRKIVAYSKMNRSKIIKNFYGLGTAPPFFYRLDKHQRNALFLLTLGRPSDLCRFLKTSILQLEKILNEPKYQEFNIRKKKGGKRQIFAPEKQLKDIQKRINYFLQAYYLWIKPNEVHGFVVNPHYLGFSCNIAENAKAHIQKKVVLNIDLKDFFPSIRARQVKAVFTSPWFNFNEQIATALTLLTTYQGQLPIGAPTSPVISNFICIQLDEDMKDFCERSGLTYTRYADDLTFSSNNEITNDHILDLINLIKKNNFRINSKKLRIKTKCQKQTVTGLTVNEKVNVDRKLLKKTRAMLHDITANGVEIATIKHFNLPGKITEKHQIKFINRLEGYINFIGQVRGKDDLVYKRFKFGFEKLDYE